MTIFATEEQRDHARRSRHYPATLRRCFADLLALYFIKRNGYQIVESGSGHLCAEHINDPHLPNECSLVSQLAHIANAEQREVLSFSNRALSKRYLVLERVRAGRSADALERPMKGEEFRNGGHGSPLRRGKHRDPVTADP